MNLLRTLSRAHRRRRTRRQLMSMDDHTLRDIGVSRGDINAVVEGLLHESTPAAPPAASPVAANANRPEVAA